MKIYAGFEALAQGLALLAEEMDKGVSRGWRTRQGHLRPAALLGADCKAKTVMRDEGHSS